MSNNVLVAGGAGFLGSHLCDRLLADQSIEKVFCLDNLQTGSQSNLAHLQRNNRFELIEGDIIDPHHFEVSQIWNLACAASPPRYQQDPIHTFKTSVYGTHNLAELAMNQNAKMFHTSTSEVYGDALISPQDESYWGNVNPVGIRSCYDEGKRAAETLLYDLHRTAGLNVKIVRIFNTYGPRMDKEDGRVVSNFIVQALQGKDLTIYGDGSQSRSFCFVDDLINVFIKIMNTSKSFTGPVNIGNPVEYSINEIAEKVIELTSSRSNLEYHPLPSDDPKQRRPDISLAKKTFGWEPKVQLEDGLRETISYFKTKLHN